MQEITRKQERKQTSELDTPRTGFSRRALLAGAVGALGLLLTGKALAEEPAKPKQVADAKPITVAKGPVPESVEAGKRMQGRAICDRETTPAMVREWDEETTRNGWRLHEGPNEAGRVIDGTFPDGKRIFFSIESESDGRRTFYFSRVGDKTSYTIDIEDLEKLVGRPVNEVRLVLEFGENNGKWYAQVYAFPVNELGAMPDFNNGPLPYLVIGYNSRTGRTYDNYGYVCQTEVSKGLPLK